MGTICKRRNNEEERKKRQNERKDLTLTGLLMVNRPILIREGLDAENQKRVPDNDDFGCCHRCILSSEKQDDGIHRRSLSTSGQV